MCICIYLTDEIAEISKLMVFKKTTQKLWATVNNIYTCVFLCLSFTLLREKKQRTWSIYSKSIDLYILCVCEHECMWCLPLLFFSFTVTEILCFHFVIANDDLRAWKIDSGNNLFKFICSELLFFEGYWIYIVNDFHNEVRRTWVFQNTSLSIFLRFPFFGCVFHWICQLNWLNDVQRTFFIF